MLWEYNLFLPVLAICFKFASEILFCGINNFQAHAVRHRVWDKDEFGTSANWWVICKRVLSLTLRVILFSNRKCYQHHLYIVVWEEQHQDVSYGRERNRGSVAKWQTARITLFDDHDIAQSLSRSLTWGQVHVSGAFFLLFVDFYQLRHSPCFCKPSHTFSVPVSSLVFLHCIILILYIREDFFFTLGCSTWLLACSQWIVWVFYSISLIEFLE